MRRDHLLELHFIAPIENVRSILKLGILSHARAAKLPHRSIAMDEIQDRRVGIIIPGTGRRLHDYANLYICGRNPMLFKRKEQEVCVLAVSTNVLDLPGVIVTDQNAASDYVRFRPAITGVPHVNEELTFAEDWRDSDRIQYYRKKAAKCAEVLVPDRVDPGYLMHAYVGNTDTKRQMDLLSTRLSVRVDKYLFFMKEPRIGES